jgi:pyruvate kinase
MRRTKIVCTVGPSSEAPDILRGMIEAGMDVARINFSHGTAVQHGRRVSLIRQIASDLGRNVALLGDLGGPKLRTGTVSKAPVLLNAGDPFTLTTEPLAGDWRGVSVSFPGLPEAVKPGESVLLNDGAIELVVESVTARSVQTRVRVGGLLGAHKGVNIPGRTLAISAFTAKDREDAGFALAQDFDWLALSFVRNPDDLRAVRKWISDSGAAVPLIAKIEKGEAIQALDGLLAESNGAMVARGDLGVEVGLEEVPFLQKEIITAALSRSVPVIVATHMLESMTTQPRPTRAEVTDVATAVLDGADAIMLSEETASGRYPVEAVRMMSRIAEHAERHIDRSRFMALTRRNQDVPGAVAQAVCALAGEVGASAILVPTWAGETPLRVASRRPTQPVIALTHEPRVRRRLALAWGTIALPVPEVDTVDEVIATSIRAARAAEYVTAGDLVVVAYGQPRKQSGTTNLIEVVRVE